MKLVLIANRCERNLQLNFLQSKSATTMICKSCVDHFCNPYFDPHSGKGMHCRECKAKLSNDARFLSNEQIAWFDENYVENEKEKHLIGTTFCKECKAQFNREIKQAHKTEFQRFEEKYGERMIVVNEDENEKHSTK